MLIVWPFKMGSKSAKALAIELEAKRVYTTGKYTPLEHHVVINWGSARIPRWNMATPKELLNSPGAVNIASNKKASFTELTNKEIATPAWTANESKALGWAEEGHLVFARTRLRGKGGVGIVLASCTQDLPSASLYTLYVKPKREFRVHVLRESVIDFVQKRKMTTETLEERDIEFNDYIRNHDNGWVFARQDVSLPEPIKQEAIDAVAALGLDFGAVDIIEDEEGLPAVLEINTAPGLEETGTTLQKYAEAFRTLDAAIHS